MQSQSDDVRMRVLNALHWDLAVPRRSVEGRSQRWLGDACPGRLTCPINGPAPSLDARNVPGVVGVINHIRLASNDAGKVSLN